MVQRAAQPLGRPHGHLSPPHPPPHPRPVDRRDRAGLQRSVLQGLSRPHRRRADDVQRAVHHPAVPAVSVRAGQAQCPQREDPAKPRGPPGPDAGRDGTAGCAHRAQPARVRTDPARLLRTGREPVLGVGRAVLVSHQRRVAQGALSHRPRVPGFAGRAPDLRRRHAGDPAGRTPALRLDAVHQGVRGPGRTGHARRTALRRLGVHRDAELLQPATPAGDGGTDHAARPAARLGRCRGDADRGDGRGARPAGRRSVRHGRIQLHAGGLRRHARRVRQARGKRGGRPDGDHRDGAGGRGPGGGCRVVLTAARQLPVAPAQGHDQQPRLRGADLRPQLPARQARRQPLG